MASIATSIEIYDRMTAPLNSMMNALNATVRAFENIDRAMNSGMNTAQIEEARKAIEDAVNEAVIWACEQNLLEGYIREQKAEVKMDLLTEYDEEAYIRVWRNDGILEGRQEKAVEAAINALEMKLSEEQAAKISGLPLEQVKELTAKIKAAAG